MKKILMLGGSAQQVIAIKKAKELGLYTIVCDYLTDNPGQYEADKFYNESTTDIEAVYRIAKYENVDGILAYASDPAALPASIVCERLKLPTNPSKTVSILGVKHLFRKFLAENNFSCPKNYVFSPQTDLIDIKENLKDLCFPIIVKPTDSSGSKGVSKLNDCNELEKAIEWATQFSRNNVLIAEEFIERGFPDVIGGDVFVVNGEILLYGEMSCLRDFDGKGLIPIGEKWPSGLNDFQTKKVHDELQRLVEALDIKFGELNIELILDNNDNVQFLEVAPRAGGNMIPLQLSDIFGLDLVNLNVMASMGQNISIKPTIQSGCFMHYVLHSYKSGQLENIIFSDKILPFIYRTVMYKEKGDKIEAFDGAGKALGIIFLHFNSYQQMYEFCQKKDSLISIKII